MKILKKVLCLALVINLIICLFSCKKKETTIGSKTFDTSKTYIICISQSTEQSDLDGMRKGFVIGMKDQGFVEDVNVKYIYENAKGNSSYAKQIADAFAEKKPDMVVGIGSSSTITLYDKFKDKGIPVVFLGCAEANKLGICDAKNMPKGNITGVMDNKLIDEKLSFIAKEYPDVKKLGIIYNSNKSASAYDVDYYKFYATAHNIDIYTVAITKDEDVDKAIENIKGKIDAYAIVTATSNDMATKISEAAKKDGKPIFGDLDEHEKMGMIVCTQRDYQLVGKKGAELAKPILLGEKKASETKVETVNYKEN